MEDSTPLEGRRGNVEAKVCCQNGKSHPFSTELMQVQGAARNTRGVAVAAQVFQMKIDLESWLTFPVLKETANSFRSWQISPAVKSGDVLYRE